jgi:hypothetical protein
MDRYTDPSMNATASPSQDTAARLRLLGAWIALAAALGCASRLEPPATPPEPEVDALIPGTVRVRLVFGAEADLDLYVTDPLMETVYFANTPTRSGGAISSDQRCESPAPRIEEVTFRQAPAGRYRIGVDFPRRCRLGVRTVPYLVIVEDGAQRVEQRGEIHFAHFEPRVLEIDLLSSDPDGAAPASVSGSSRADIPNGDNPPRAFRRDSVSPRRS